jgi:hypothetical protein
LERSMKETVEVMEDRLNMAQQRLAAQQSGD